MKGNRSYSGDCSLLVLLCFDGNFKTVCFTFEFKQNTISSIKITTYNIY